MHQNSAFDRLIQFHKVHGKLPDVFFFNPDDKHLVAPINGVEYRYSSFIERHTFIIGLKDNIDLYFKDDGQLLTNK